MRKVYIELKTAIEFVKKYAPTIDGMTTLGCVERALYNAPNADVTEVVRCKDCKHRTVTSDGMVCECALPTKRMQDYYIYGSTILARVEPDAFCSHGERREGE